MIDYDYYKAEFSFCTAQKASRLGHKITIPYGYYVLVNPPNFYAGKYNGMESIQSWCRTKNIAQGKIEDLKISQIKGYFGCPCGSNKQARACCGTPK
jgi:hypothetical protein